jgi:hypothetical protein
LHGGFPAGEDHAADGKQGPFDQIDDLIEIPFVFTVQD